MATDPQLEQSFATLSAGNIVTVGLQLFHNRGGNYFVASLLAHIWLGLSLVGVLMVGGIFVGIVVASNQGDWVVALPSIGVVLLLVSPFLTFAVGRFTAAGGFIVRRIFNRLLDLDEPEEESRQQIFPRLWTYGGAVLISFVILLVVYVALGGVAYVLWQIFAPLIEITSRSDYDFVPLVFTALLVVYLLLNFGLLLIAYYVTARLWFCDAILALEDEVNAWQAVQRSWQVTQTQGFNVMAVLFIGTVLSYPALLVANVLSYVVPFASVLFGIFLFPVWQAIKTIHYYELRSRNEGFAFDLERTLVQPRKWLRRVAIQTPEQIELDFALAGVGSRIFAWVADFVLLAVGLFLLWYLGSALYFAVLPTLAETFGAGTTDNLNLWVAAIASFITYVLSNGYHIACETFWQGQTPGKWLAKIRVIQADGRPVTLREAALRSLIGPIDNFFFFIGLLLITFSKSERRLGDLAAGTLVIQNEKRQATQKSSVALRFGQQAQATAQTLHEEANLSELSADQFLILRNFLGYRVKLDPHIRKQVTVRLATQLQQILTPPDTGGLNIPEEELLEATYVACRKLVYNN